MPRPTAKSLTFDLLSTLRRGAMPVRALVAAAGLFGISENSLRVCLARLCAAGQIERDSRGRYRLGDAALAIDGHVQSWRHAHERLCDWAGSETGPSGEMGRGRWVAVQARVSRPRSKQFRAGARALLLHGFRELADNLYLRPDNLSGGVDNLRDSLLRVGLDAQCLVFGLDALDADREAQARSLWQADRLAPLYTRTRRELEQSEQRLARADGLNGLGLEDAMVESFLLGGRAIRTIALDPLLPHPIVEHGQLAELVAATRRYERAGRVCWAAFLAEHGVIHQRAPVDARVDDAARALPSSVPEGVSA